MKTYLNNKVSLLLLGTLSLAACTKNDVPVDSNGKNNNTPGRAVVPTTYAGYDLVWHDEFEGTALDKNKWNYETGTGINGDFGTGQLDRATDRVQNVSVKPVDKNSTDGALNITTLKERFVDRDYTSGRINTKGKFACGPGYRIEAKIWARDVRYKGQGFAFWLMPDQIPPGQTELMWPQGGEIDVMEYVGAIPNYNLGSVHYAFSWQDNKYQSWNHGHKGGYYGYADKQVPANNPNYGGWPVAANSPAAGSGGYHIYRVEFFSDRLEFSVDDQVYHTNYFNDGAAFNNAPDGQDEDRKIINNKGKRVYVSEYSHHFNEWRPFNHNFFIILSAGVGGNDNMTYGGRIVPEAVFPCSTLVDWVRVYKRKA